MQTPDLAQADFEHLTISNQLRLIDRMVGADPVSLMGSSLGGYLAASYATSHQNVQKVVLLAPAFGFLDLWEARLGPAEMKRWRESNQLSVYHYGDKRERNLHFELMADASHYPLVPDFHQPTLILHGNNDDTVPVSASIDFAASHPNATLVRLESDHELGNVLDRIWQESSEFLLGPPLAKSVLG